MGHAELRLQKYVAECGAASRRKAEEMITAGRVSVNGLTVTELGTKVREGEDEVRLDGRLIRPERRLVYVMLNKPEGYVTSASDPEGRPTVMELVREIPERLVPVGRLDYNTSGLLLLTNDGGLVFRLTHPRHEVAKTYAAKLMGVPGPEALRKFRGGVYIDGVKTAPAKIKVLKIEDDPQNAADRQAGREADAQAGGAADSRAGHAAERRTSGVADGRAGHEADRRTSVAANGRTGGAANRKANGGPPAQDGRTASVRITIHEGRNRQIRKMCEAIGHPVLFLKRVGTGEVFLGELKRGEWRYLTGEEVEYLKGV